MAISVGSVEVDVIPNTQGIYARLRSGLVPAATRAGEDAGSAAGRAFGPAMQRQVGDIGLRIGEEIGQQIANRITAALRDAVRDGVTRGGQTARPAAVRQGDETAGAFSRALKTRLEAAFRSLPKLQIGADTSEVDSDLQAVRVRMETLADKRIGIDISAEDAKAEIRLIEAELTRLGAEHPNVQVRADTARALAELQAVRAEIDAVDGKKARFDIDASGATGSILQLTAALAGVAVIPAIPALAAALGSVAAAGVAAAVGVGALAAVALPAITSIGGVLMAQKQAQDAATNSTLRGGQAASQAASRALQMAGAQQALATAHRNAARQIAQAEQGVQDAVRSAAEANRNAAQQVKTARQGLADAYQQAADRMRSANEQVQQAERSLADAQDAARQAQQDLTQARRDAAMQLEDLNNRLADSQLSERDAVLSVQEARKRLDAVQAAGANASLLQQQRAQLAYDQAVQRLKEQRLETARTAAEKAAADKAGVEGSDAVKSAQERLAAAQQAVKDQQAAVAKAQQAAARQQIQNTKDIASAQEKLAEAQRNVTKVQEDGARSVARAQESLVAAQQSAADSIASAQRQIESASLSAAGGVDQAAIAQQKYQEKLAKLTPAARATFNAFVDLRKAFGDWSKSLQPAVMPLFTRALNGLKNALPGLTPLVRGAAAGIGELMDRASAGFKQPWWKSFKQDLDKSVKPAIVGLGVAFGNIFKGMVGVIGAFLPHMDTISNKMQTVTGKFADWGTSLKGSPAFERFLDYSAAMGPRVADTIGKLALAFFSVGQALSPVSGPLLSVIGKIADGVVYIAENLPWLIQGLYGAWVAMKLVNLAMGISPIGWLAIALVGLVVAIQYAWTHFEGFRNVVLTVWEWVKSAFQGAWIVISPILGGLIQGIKKLGDIVMWIWVHLIKPGVDLIVGGFKWLYNILVGHSIIPDLVRAATSWFRSLARGIKLIFDGIKLTIRLAWDGIKAIWEGVRRYIFGPLTSAFRWIRDKVVKPVFNGISSTIGGVWRNGIRPAFDAIKSAIHKVADAFESARKAIKTAWDKIKDATKTPINWVLRVVWNNGIVKIWDKITGWIPGVPKLGKLDYLAQGGKLRGPQPGMYNAPTAIVGEGNPRYPEYVIPTDPKYRARALALHQAAGTQMLAKGGVIGSATDFFGNPIKSFGNMLKPFMDKAKGLGKTSWGKAAIGLPTMAINGLKKLIKDAVGSWFTRDASGALKFIGKVGKGVQRWTPQVLQALKEVHQPASYLGITLRRMNQESGGNPLAVNLWDSNAKAGYPSTGLMQVIRPTFQHYAGKYRKKGPFMYGVSVDPLANIYSSMRYALAAYGSLPRAYNRAGGYDSGGYLQPGLNLAYNGTGRPEPVFTTQQANALMRLAVEPGGASLNGQQLQLVLDDGTKFTAHLEAVADGRIAVGNRQLISTLRANRRG
ncbi:transglycosylase SLT domain-containing protein [Streptomyces sp. 5-6(2022)]|uniref:transglycosylase SLT domain-containing protein n=1 Tax=Streptomyces sp. 5-6(2022) TaxID=2936510 RepID=UPI0023B9F755|nr:transglycosylase SLT domain-containing protein [Streptomyces sp. 5-6(2022)]